MIKKHPHHVLVTCLIGFKPQIGFPLKLAEAGAAIEAVMEKPNWTYVNNHNAIMFPEPNRRSLLVLAFNHIQIETLGLNPWLEENERYARLAVKSLNSSP